MAGGGASGIPGGGTGGDMGARGIGRRGSLGNWLRAEGPWGAGSWVGEHVPAAGGGEPRLICAGYGAGRSLATGPRSREGAFG